MCPACSHVKRLLNLDSSVSWGRPQGRRPFLEGAEGGEQPLVAVLIGFKHQRG
jgi:hypothetical protein